MIQETTMHALDTETVSCDFSISAAQTIVRALNHLIHNTETTGASEYGIDRFCRSDCANRMREISKYITSRLPMEKTTVSRS